MSGFVTDADQDRVHIAPADTDLVVELHIDNQRDLPLKAGHHISFSGTIAADRTIVISPDDQVWVRAPWERLYMYAISFAGAFLTTLLIGNDWRYDPDDRVIEPREPPRVTLFGK